MVPTWPASAPKQRDEGNSLLLLGRGASSSSLPASYDTFLAGKSRSALLLLPWHNKVEVTSLPLSYVESPDVPLGLLWRYPRRGGIVISSGLSGCPHSPLWCLPLTLPLVGGLEDEERYSPVGIKVPAFLFTQHSLTLSWQGIPCYSLVRVNVSSSHLSLCWYKSRATICCGDAWQ